MIQFWVDGVPKAQPRPRMTRKGHVYNPPSADHWKDRIMWAARSANIRKTRGPVRLTVSFAMPGGETRVNGEPHISKPDADNLLKALMDALTTIHAWDDDCQVFDIRVIKRYGEPTGVLITIEEVSS